MRAIQIQAYGGPEVLAVAESEAPQEPGPGEVRVRHEAIGVNFIDTYHRTGFYPLTLPSGMGIEAAGVVEALGEGVDALSVGTRVAYVHRTPGAYADVRMLPAETLVPLPEHIDTEMAATMMVKSMTAAYLLHHTYAVQPGDALLVHAAAGGVGIQLCAWAAALGAQVIGTVSTEAKAQLAAEAGCHHPILYTREDVATRVRELTQGKGVRVVYDSVGRDTFEGSLKSLAPLGLLVSYGQSSGPVPPLDVGTLARHGSLFLTRPTLFTHIAQAESRNALAQLCFDAVKAGTLSPRARHRYALEDAQDAHRDLEARKTAGAIILLPRSAS